MEKQVPFKYEMMYDKYEKFGPRGGEADDFISGRCTEFDCNF